MPWDGQSDIQGSESTGMLEDEGTGKGRLGQPCPWGHGAICPGLVLGGILTDDYSGAQVCYLLLHVCLQVLSKIQGVSEDSCESEIPQGHPMASTGHWYLWLLNKMQPWALFEELL